MVCPVLPAIVNDQMSSWKGLRAQKVWGVSGMLLTIRGHQGSLAQGQAWELGPSKEANLPEHLLHAKLNLAAPRHHVCPCWQPRPHIQTAQLWLAPERRGFLDPLRWWFYKQTPGILMPYFIRWDQDYLMVSSKSPVGFGVISVVWCQCVPLFPWGWHFD